MRLNFVAAILLVVAMTAGAQTTTTSYPPETQNPVVPGNCSQWTRAEGQANPAAVGDAGSPCNGGAGALCLMGNSAGAEYWGICGPVSGATYTVATLPTCNSGSLNTQTVVTDSTGIQGTATSPVVGGGSIWLPVWCADSTVAPGWTSSSTPIWIYY
jgi:hypothetical protein